MTDLSLINKSGERSRPIEPDIPDYIHAMSFSVIASRFVAVMAMQIANRGMIASQFHTRCVQQGEVHELVCLYEDNQGRIDLNDAWYLGFIEFCQSCVLAKGMRVEINGECVGRLVAFDMTHAPNHLNILLAHPSPRTGREKNIQIGENAIFQ